MGPKPRGTYGFRLVSLDNVQLYLNASAVISFSTTNIKISTYLTCEWSNWMAMACSHPDLDKGCGSRTLVTALSVRYCKHVLQGVPSRVASSITNKQLSPTCFLNQPCQQVNFDRACVKLCYHAAALSKGAIHYLSGTTHPYVKRCP